LPDFGLPGKIDFDRFRCLDASMAVLLSDQDMTSRRLFIRNFLGIPPRPRPWVIQRLPKARELRLYGNHQDHRKIVKHADDQRVVFSNGSETDQAGNLMRSGNGDQIDPVSILVPTELAVGRKWRSAFRVVRHDNQGFGNGAYFSTQRDYSYWDREVTAREPLVIPAGSFDTLKIEGTSSGAAETYWIDARTLLMVKSVLRMLRGGTRSTQVLVSAPDANPAT
jgi:hypothetical protein